MKIRRALLGEVPTIARVATEAFAKDPSYGHFYPWRHYYPDDFYVHLLHRYSGFMATPGCVIIVMELEEDDLIGDTEAFVGKVVGFAIWQVSNVTRRQQDEWNGEDSVDGGAL